MGTPRAASQLESQSRSVSATINYTRPIAERLHIDVRDFSRVCRHDDAHRWYYFSGLARDEVIVFKAFDSAAPDALNVAHTAFDDPSAPANAVPRSSIESRFVAFFD